MSIQIYQQRNSYLSIIISYGLFDYTKEDANNGRILNIKVAEENFRLWLIGYRARATAAQEDDENI